MSDLHDPLTPVRAALAELAPLPGLAPGLIATEPEGWCRATELANGQPALTDLLSTARECWRGASDAVVAALAWKSYAYWVALPAVVGFAAARAVPLVRADDVVVRWSVTAQESEPFVVVGLLPTAEVAVLPTSRWAREWSATRQAARVSVTPDEEAMLSLLRQSLLDEHLSPITERLRALVHVGHRPLIGSTASTIVTGLMRATAQTIGGPAATGPTARLVLDRLGLGQLVDLDASPPRRRTCCLRFKVPGPRGRQCRNCCFDLVTPQ